MQQTILQHIKEQEQELINRKIEPVSVSFVSLSNKFKQINNITLKKALNGLIKDEKLYFYQGLNDIFLTTKKPKEG